MNISDVLVEVLEGFKEFSRAMIKVTFEKLLFRNKIHFFDGGGR